MTPGLAPENAAYSRLSHAKLGRDFLLGETCSAKTPYRANVIIGELRTLMAHAFRHIDVSATHRCLGNNMISNTEHFGDLADLPAFGSKFNGQRNLIIANGSFASMSVSKNFERMTDVLVVGNPFEVADVVIGLDAVLVIAYATECGSNEAGHNQEMDQPSRPHIVDADGDARISGTSQCLAKNAPAVNSRCPSRGSRERSDTAEIRDFVMVRKFGDRAPFFDIAHDTSCGDEHPTMSTEGLRFPQ